MTKKFDWLKDYKKLSPGVKYQRLLAMVSEPFPKGKYTEKDSEMWSDIFRDCVEFLDQHCQYEQIFTLASAYQTHNPGFLGKRAYYFHYTVATYKLFLGEIAEDDFASFCAEPLQAIDHFIPHLNTLSYYGYQDLAAKLSMRVVPTLLTGTWLLKGGEMEFCTAIESQVWQAVYESLKVGKTTDLALLRARLEKYEVAPADLFDLCYELLSNPGQTLGLELERPVFVQFLLQFCVYAFETWQMNFATAMSIFEALSLLLVDYPNNFELHQERLERDLSGRLDVISNAKPSAFAIIWGIPYYYDFLLEKGLVSAAVHADSLCISEVFKESVMRDYANSLWKYGFVHRWLPTDNTPLEQIEWEKELFEASFERCRAGAEKAGKRIYGAFDFGI